MPVRCFFEWGTAAFGYLFKLVNKSEDSRGRLSYTGSEHRRQGLAFVQVQFNREPLALALLSTRCDFAFNLGPLGGFV